MKISILSRYPVIHRGLISMLQDKYSDITSFSSIDEYCKHLDNIKNKVESNILIVTIFNDEMKFINNILNIKENLNNFKLLVIDFNEKKDTFFKLSKVNIDGYMLGTLVSEDIHYAILKISNGIKFYDRDLIFNLVENEPLSTINNQLNTSNRLTKREIEILSQLSNGISNYEIACNLNISENTVKKHISNIFLKIDVKDRTQATIYAYDIGLVTKQ